MSDAVQSLVQYGYVLLFVFVLAEQIGLPVPAVPVLLGVGASSAGSRSSPTPASGARKPCSWSAVARRC